MISIQTATLQDLPTIRQIAFQTWPATFGEILSPSQIEYMLDMMYSNNSLKGQIEQKNHVFLLAKLDEEAVGYASYELDYGGQPKTKIHKIYLLPACQGKGVGAALFKKIEEIAIENKNDTLTLNVNRYNRAVGFYEKIGFEIVGQEDIDIGQGFLMQDFIMEKKIG
ncbi:MAG: GNAT family N-acetyltransferase [Runella sp.]